MLIDTLSCYDGRIPRPAPGVRSMSIAVNRHHAKRLKAKRKHYWNVGGKRQNNKAVGIIFHTPCKCSCTMCGNQRKHWGRPIQEVKQAARFSDTVTDI
ncbi:hypothetical protein RAY_85 [Erwinia phage vB_EamM_RAY]|uniref:Uncharacterized protein n=3 Tax=Agricanvirus TaxID=1984776 RepID=A0A173GDY4_9CAUD|nr:hypothetical protein FDH98_gp085 [Erwinia phage vB_EamM_RAY]YP_009605872.1 hypothetical protein FDH99_gp088 [Erwinia phage vB_EamM_Simmy50]ANH51550.1 hypothetical protein SIMMY50_88 [Erwinia phage vB_EamM_Simmy50]ANH51866.1 hypothetical protein RAY_85 [Erwinia phage vB_EamM_RAY]